MAIQRRTIIAAGLAAPAIARAQSGEWPSRPVRLIVPFGPGGAIDTLSRFIAQRFAAATNGGSLVVENRAGGGGTIGATAAAQARPDGYTLLMGDMGANVLAGELVRGVGYDPLRAFTPVIHLVNLPIVVLAKRDAPYSDLAGMIAAAKVRPEAVIAAHPGAGHPSHLTTELLQRRAGVRFLHTPYRSGAELMQAIVKGEGDIGAPTVSSGAPFIREGQAKALAVASARPVEVLPGVPTVAATFDGFDVSVWHGILAPAGLPTELTTRINDVFGRMLADGELQTNLKRAQAAEIVGGTPEAFRAFIERQVGLWVPVVREAGIRAE
ncbi:Bug family tripartite tricarboxylate transporter substrate binding protein [Roseomonas sp. CCTCC AB2023176]|uniref:Bug family tripartite tricarboxylate transporter substrate binding protein n=1 Tax=Roseomonas sp. CCTCC AB2023176 TaxID=3342640 RepID=UPI0035DB52AB